MYLLHAFMMPHRTFLRFAITVQKNMIMEE